MDAPVSLAGLLARAQLPYLTVSPIDGVSVSSLSDDSRTARPGACFVAMRGSGGDGHAFVAQAAARGACAAIVERVVESPAGLAVARVDCTRSALARLAAAFYGLTSQGRDGQTGSAEGVEPFGPARGGLGIAHREADAAGLRLLGVTGTNGKTTVAWLLRSVLRVGGRRPALLGTIEYDLLDRRTRAGMTTPGPLELCRCLAEARRAGATDAVLEVSSHALDQRRTDGLVFAAGVFTNLSQDHLDYHKTMDEYRACKRRLFEGLGADAVAVVNADDPSAGAMVEGARATIVRYGLTSSGANVTAAIRRTAIDGCEFVLRTDRGEMDIRLQLPGRHNVLNALAAAATARALALPPEAIRDGLEEVRGVPGRLQRVSPDGHPFAVFVDYAHTDDALTNVLACVRPLTAGRVICVFGCGGDRDRGKRPRMAAAVERAADVAIVTSDNPRSEAPGAIIEEILCGFSASRRVEVQVEPERRAAISLALRLAQPGDTVLIAGKGHEDYQLVGDRTLPFDDASVARSFLEAGGEVDGAGRRAGEISVQPARFAASCAKDGS